jgi:hypothetical protein
VDSTILCFKETEDDRGQGCYTLVRFYRHRELIIRVTVKRDPYREQSRAHAEVLTPGLTWTTLITDPTCRWYGDTSIWARKPTQAHREMGFTTLGRIADGLYHDAVEILFP